MYCFSRKFCLVLVVAACAAAGCTDADRQKWDTFWGIKKKPPADTKGSQTTSISIDELARRLGLRVAGTSTNSATLTNAANRVVIVGDPRGRVYVNGKAVAHTGSIRTVGGVLCVPTSVTSLLRPMLRAAGSTGSEPKTVSGTKTVQPDRQKLPVVVVDAGHGGRDPGAVRTYGGGRVRVQIQEKGLNLDVALVVSRLLGDSGVPVVMTRTEDSTVSLDERVKIADQTGPALMVSIHADANNNSDANGFTVYVGKNALPASLTAAKMIERRLAKTSVHSKGVRRHEKPIRVLVVPKCPSVLVEMGYLSNEQEAARLKQADHRMMLAKAIAGGIMDYLEEGKK